MDIRNIANVWMSNTAVTRQIFLARVLISILHNMLPRTVLRYSTSAKRRHTKIFWMMLHAKLIFCSFFRSVVALFRFRGRWRRQRWQDLARVDDVVPTNRRENGD